MRVIIRRPHAYFFIDETFKEQGGIRSVTPAGCQLADGSLAPLPGIYFLDEDGKHIASAAITSAENLREAMADAKAK